MMLFALLSLLSPARASEGGARHTTIALLRLESLDPAAHLQLGRDLEQAGLPHSAEAHYQAALLLSSDKPEETELFDAALARLTANARSLRDDSSLLLLSSRLSDDHYGRSADGLLYYLAGRERFEAEDWEVAAELLARVPPSSPQFTHARYMLGRIYDRHRHTRDAVDALRDAAGTMPPKDALVPETAAGLRSDALLAMAAIYGRLKLPAQAAQQCQAVVDAGVDPEGRPLDPERLPPRWAEAAECAARYHLASDGRAAAERDLALLADPNVEGAFFTPQAAWMRAELADKPWTLARLQARYEWLEAELTAASDVLSPALAWQRYCISENELPEEIVAQACGAPAAAPLLRRWDQVQAELEMVAELPWPDLERQVLTHRLQADKIRIEDEIGRAAQAELRRQRDALALLLQ